MDPDSVANQFLEFYYSLFDGDRGKLLPVYRQGSMLTWEGNLIPGANNIIEKITTLPFKTVVHKVVTRDVQPVENGTILICVTGLLIVDESPNPLQFSQVFTLKLDEKGYYVFNDIFRLNYGA